MLHKLPVRLFIGLLTLIVFALINGILAQSQATIPLPASNPRTRIELLTNGDFETDINADKIPDHWKASNTTFPKSDKLKCDQLGQPVAHGGVCAFMFRGNPNGSLSKIQQTITDTSAIVNGASVTFSVYVDAHNITPNTKIGLAKLIYSDGTSTKLTLLIPDPVRAAEDYVLSGASQVVSLPIGVSVTKVKVDFRYRGTTGKFFIDDVNFNFTLDDLTITPTDTPTNTAVLPTFTATQVTATSTNTGLTATATTSPSQTDTFTPTNHLPTSTPTETLTSTLIPPTITPTSTATLAVFKLVDHEGASGSGFGRMIAIDGDTLVVGNAGLGLDEPSEIHIFIRSGNTWIPQQVLLPEGDDPFAYSFVTVAISGDTLVAVDAKCCSTSRAHVYVRSNGLWTHQQTLLVWGEVWDGVLIAAIDGDTIVIGTYVNFAGSVIIFNRSGNVWTQQQVLLGTGGFAIDSDSLAIVDGWIGNDEARKVNVYTRIEGVWTFQQAFIPDDFGPNDRLGNFVDISGDTLILHTYNSVQQSQSVYIFERNNGIWTQRQKLAGELLGVIDGETLLGGDPSADIGTNVDQGVAYLYTRNGNIWTQQYQLTASDGEAGDNFGFFMALDGNTAVVGAENDDIGANTNQGSVWVYELP